MVELNNLGVAWIVCAFWDNPKMHSESSLLLIIAGGYMTYTSKNELPISQWNIKSMPLEIRPDEKLERLGAVALSDEELLAIIIRTGFQGNNSVCLAEKILKCAGDKGLTGLCRVSIEELMQVRGVGFVKAVQIKAVAELTRRIAKRTAKERIVMDSPDTIAEYYMEDMRHKERECFMLLSLDGKGSLIGESIISMGTVNSSLASPREVFIEALKQKAVSIILMHNHPSGNPSPSQNDILVTRKMREIGEILGIPLVDHIIIGDNSYVSLKEENMM